MLRSLRIPVRKTVAALRPSLPAFLLALAAGTGAAQTLLTGPAGSVTAADLLAAGARTPQAARDALYARPDSVRRQAEDLYIRRALATEAERDALDRDPAVQAQLRLARERVLSDARLERIDAAALPSDAEVTRYARELYRENPQRFKLPAQTRASHILVRRGDDGKGRERAQELLAQLRAGAPFERLAREHSADGASAGKGGDLGWFSAGQMVKEFDQAMTALQKPGDLSDVVETQFGYHIVRLDERRDAGARSFDEVRDDLERDVRVRLTREARQQKMRALLADAQPDLQAIGAFTQPYQNKP